MLAHKIDKLPAKQSKTGRTQPVNGALAVLPKQAASQVKKSLLPSDCESTLECSLKDYLAQREQFANTAETQSSKSKLTLPLPFFCQDKL